ncbi:helix-turn-helix transcriptional regulator [Clostridium botulinum]|uniref:helix-turn-helix domain-containing protein n=1 Tax=Clostridium botulinum TaxID=1491 RepID=UPI00174DDD13|nr:helix-turn-helix domain-containing protein [Clostridium botulinum]MBD5637566.1 helix-turn-helix transcriptional regulator [Clostridium botulinum]
MPDLGQLIKHKREAARLSMKKLGMACNVSDSEIMKIENGTRKNPNWNTLCEIAHTLNFHPFEILLAAGYITKNDIHPNSQIHGLEKLNADEVAIIQLFIDFLTMRSSNLGDVSKEEK